MVENSSRSWRAEKKYSVAAAALVNFCWLGGAPGFFRRRDTFPAGSGGDGIRRLRGLAARRRLTMYNMYKGSNRLR